MNQLSELKNEEKPTVISLFFSDTGGGHRSAVDAIQTAIEQICAERGTRRPVKVVCDNVVEKSHPINRFFVEFYNYLLRHNQAMMKYYYAFVEWFKPDESDFGWRLTKPHLEKTVRAFDADITVSVHPMCNQYLARCLKETGLDAKSKLVTVVTDPNGEFWSGWACKGSDLTIAPNDLSKERLINLGVDENKIVVLGMPVHPDFRNPPTYSKEEFRHNLGLSRDLPTICINAGWAGGGNMMDIYRALQKVKRPVQVIFLCGHNQNLYATMKRDALRSAIPTAVLPFHDRLADVMAASDLMVTKAGGLTTFESIARHLPMAIDTITDPMPQELGTAKILVEAGLGQRVHVADDIVSIVENMVLREEFAMKPISATHQLDRVDAVFDIAETILKLANVEFLPAPIVSPPVTVSPAPAIFGHTASTISANAPASVSSELAAFVSDSGDTVASFSSPV